jgi:hypothetical protein
MPGMAFGRGWRPLNVTAVLQSGYRPGGGQYKTVSDARCSQLSEISDDYGARNATLDAANFMSVKPL